MERRYPRSARVNEVVREVLAEEIERLSDPRLGFVTVMGVEVSPDLRTARVFYSALEEVLEDESAANGDEAGQVDQDDGAEAEEHEVSTAKALESARKHLQSALGRQVRLKYLPRLVFVRDPAITSGQRIDDVIRHLHEGPVGEGHEEE